MQSTESTNNVPHTLKTLRSLAVAAFAVILATNLGLAARNPNPGLIKPGGQYRGEDISEKAVEWWQTMYSIPVVNDQHPLLTGGAVMGEDNLLFLATSAAPGPSTIQVTVPSQASIFFPVVNAECSTVESEPFHGDNEAEMRSCANGHIDQTANLAVTIDGVPVNSLQSYREQSPLFSFTLPENNVLQFLGETAPAGTTSEAVDAGIYLLLKPLTPGAHTIHVSGSFTNLGTTINTTFQLTVQ
jgi:hypothetical protein